MTNSIGLVAYEPEPDTDRVEAVSRPDPYPCPSAKGNLVDPIIFEPGVSPVFFCSFY